MSVIQLFSQIIDKTVANSTVETSLFQLLGNNNVINASEFLVGNYLKVKCSGFFRRQSGGLTINVKLGGVVILTTGGVSAGINSVHNWIVEVMFNYRSAGVNGSVMAQGFLINLGNGNITEMLSVSSVPLDLSDNKVFDITAQWSAANPTNTITCTNVFRDI